MNKDQAKELLKNQKSLLRENLKKYQNAEKDIDDEGSDVLGPRDDLEYQKMINDIKESGNDKG